MEKNNTVITLQSIADDFITECKVRRLAPKTIDGYRKLLKMFLVWIGDKYGADTVDSLSVTHIKHFILYKEEQGKTANYINDILKVLRLFCRYMYDEGIADRVYTDRLKNVRQPKVKINSFSESEIKGMVNYYSGNGYLEVRNKLMISLFFDTGMRCNELISLTESSIRKGFIFIHGKGDKDRVVPLSPVVGKMLRPYHQVCERFFYGRKIHGDNLFLSKNGRPMTNEAIRKILLKAAEAVGVRETVRVSPHTLRHTYAHTQLRNGCDIFTLSKLLGHESISITQQYLEGIEDEQILKTGLEHSPLMNIRGIK